MQDILLTDINLLKLLPEHIREVIQWIFPHREVESSMEEVLLLEQSGKDLLQTEVRGEAGEIPGEGTNHTTLTYYKVTSTCYIVTAIPINIYILCNLYRAL